MGGRGTTSFSKAATIHFVLSRLTAVAVRFSNGRFLITVGRSACRRGQSVRHGVRYAWPPWPWAALVRVDQYRLNGFERVVVVGSTRRRRHYHKASFVFDDYHQPP
jgi:hypothetical protein